MRLIIRVVRLVVLLFALVIALDKFGFQIAPLVAGIGVASLGIGIALQGVHIEIVGVRGDVATIELFSTTLVHPDRSRIIIPNRKIVGEILHNFGTMRELHLSVVVPHGSRLPGVVAVAREVAGANPRVLKDPAPVVGVAQIEPLGVRIGVTRGFGWPTWCRPRPSSTKRWWSASGRRGSACPCPDRRCGSSTACRQVPAHAEG